MYRLLLLVVTIFWLGLAHADVLIKDATIRLLPPSVPNTSAYFMIENRFDEPLVLVGASVNFAGKAELHNHVMDGGLMRMEQQSEVTIEPNQILQFSPGGLHIMLFGLKQPLIDGQNVTITLLSKKGVSIDFQATVARPKAKAHAHH
jgi:copper(I)-binding protein